MLKLIQVFTLLNAYLLLSSTEARRIRVRPARPVIEAEEPADQEEQPQRVEYYAAESQEPQDAAQQKLVLVTNDGEVYNGLYGRALERGGTDAQYSRAISRAGLIAQPRPTRVKEPAREPPVQTLRNYSKVNDDGSFTFGYEAADGSFKEETRGTDCVVRGKYGYVDPDGNKREFTYVSGNPCDPNAPQEEEEKEESEESGEENVPPNIPQNIPRRPVRPLRPLPKPVGRPATTLFQQDFNTENSALPEEEPQQPQVYLHQTGPVRSRVPTRPVPVQLPVPAEKPESIVRVTPRPVTPPTPATLPATTYRPQLLVSVTPRPNVVLTKHSTLGHPAGAPSPAPVGGVDFEEELKRFQLENNVVTTPRTLGQPSAHKPEQPGAQPGQPVYTSELVFDPSTGQYNTVVYQQIPKTTADITLKTRLPQLVQPAQPQHQPPPQQPPQLQHQPQPQPPHQPQRPEVVRQPANNLLQQQLFQQQKQVLIQQSQELFNQQRNQQLQSQHRFQPTFTPTTIQYQPVPSTITPTTAKPSPVGFPKFESSAEAQRAAFQARPSPGQYYYFAPQSSASEQLDAFLRGHNYQF